MAYQFDEQLEKGKAVEDILDRFFDLGHGYKITPASMAQQRRGIDRLFIRGPKWWTVEYKADFKTVETGNVFVETVSVGRYTKQMVFRTLKEGWAKTCCADRLIYYPVGTGRLLVLEPEDIKILCRKHAVSPDDSPYKSVRVRNQGYYGEGLLVPVPDIEKLAKRVLEIQE